MSSYVSRGGEKLAFALEKAGLKIDGKVCADFGSSTGGFVDCLIQNGAKKVYAVETGFGVLDWKLRQNPKVFVLERTNAMHVTLPEKPSFISIDTSWTRLSKILPNALSNLGDGGDIIALIKPHYEAKKLNLIKGKVPEERIYQIVGDVEKEIEGMGLVKEMLIESPILGGKAGNKEFLIHLRKKVDWS